MSLQIWLDARLMARCCYCACSVLAEFRRTVGSIKTHFCSVKTWRYTKSVFKKHTALFIHLVLHVLSGHLRSFPHQPLFSTHNVKMVCLERDTNTSSTSTLHHISTYIHFLFILFTVSVYAVVIILKNNHILKSIAVAWASRSPGALSLLRYWCIFNPHLESKAWTELTAHYDKAQAQHQPVDNDGSSFRGTK